MNSVKFYFFIDESGDHSLKSYDPTFPIFNLCGILVSEENYKTIDERIKKIKTKYWGKESIIFHSREIRKKENEFSILSNKGLNTDFIHDINELIMNSKFRIISSIIHKPKYIGKYGSMTEQVYELCFMFMIERVVFSLDEVVGVENKSLEIIVEKRGKKEDRKLKKFF